MASINLPAPDGQYCTSSSVALLTDESRRNLYAAAPGDPQCRQIMVSSFRPATLSGDCAGRPTRYVPDKTAAFLDRQLAPFGIPDGTFRSLHLAHCDLRCGHDLITDQDFPVVLFSPGFRNSRLVYSATAQALASRGHIVITIDHPYDADIVEYPDGSTTLAADMTDVQKEALVDVRVRDVAFVLDQLHTKRISKQLLGKFFDIEHKRLAIFGHSLGGATAAAAAASDSRLMAAINIDGRLFDRPTKSSDNANKSLLIVARDGRDFANDPAWSLLLDATRETVKAVVTIPNTVHGSYTDYPLIADALGLRSEAHDGLAEHLGSVPGVRLRKVVVDVVAHFVGYCCGRKEMPLPEMDSTDLGNINIFE